MALYSILPKKNLISTYILWAGGWNHKMPRKKLSISVADHALLLWTRCSRSVGNKQRRLSKLTRSKGNAKMFNQIGCCTFLFLLTITDATRSKKNIRRASSKVRAAWLKCKRRAMRLISAWQPGARRVSFWCSLLSQNPRSWSPFRGCTCLLILLYLQQLGTSWG